MASPKQNLLRPLLTGYCPLKGTYDEYFKDQNSPRAGLKGLTRLLDDLGEHEFRLRQQLAEQPDFATFEDRWLLRILMADVHIGHLNIAEAAIEMANAPVETAALLAERPERVRCENLEHGLSLQNWMRWPLTTGQARRGRGPLSYLQSDITVRGEPPEGPGLVAATSTACLDAVKFQKRTPELCVPEHQRDRLRDTPWGTMTYLRYRERIELGADAYTEIDRLCRERGKHLVVLPKGYGLHEVIHRTYHSFSQRSRSPPAPSPRTSPAPRPPALCRRSGRPGPAPRPRAAGR